MRVFPSKKVIKVSFLVLIPLISVFLFSGSSKALYNWQWIDSNIPYFVQNQISQYDNDVYPNPPNNPNQYFLTSWISPWGAPSYNGAPPSNNASVINVNSGQQSVALQLNTLIYLYHTIVQYQPRFPADGYPNGTAQNDLLQSRTVIDGITPYNGPGVWGCVSSSGGAPGQNPCAPPQGGYPSGQTVTIGYTGGTRFWNSGINTSLGFYFVPPGGFTQTVTVELAFTTTTINEYHNNPSDSWCANTAGIIYAGSPTNWGACPSVTAPFFLTFQVQEQPPVFNIDNATCTQLAGWAFDPNDSSASINVDVYVNGAAGSGAPGNRYLANGYRPDVDAYFGISGNHGFNIDPMTDPFLRQFALSGKSFTVSLYAIGVNASGQLDGDNPYMGTRTIGPCVNQFNIDNTGISVNLSPGASSVTISSSITANLTSLSGSMPISLNGISYAPNYYVAYTNNREVPLPTSNSSLSFGPTWSNGNVSTSVSNTFSLGGYNLGAGDEVCAIYTVSPQQGLMDDSGNPVPGSTSGTAGPSVPDCQTISNHPYAKFYGNDVFSGTNFNNSSVACDPSQAQINGYGGSSGVQATGSGSEFAALSLGQISNFASAFLRQQKPVSPYGLTFANYNVPFMSLEDGNLGGSCLSVPNYYELMPSSVVKQSTNTYDPHNPIATNVLITPQTGNTVTISPSGNINSSQSIFVNGNVYINSSVNFGSNGYYDASTGKTVNVPSLYIVALGNIYIDPSVSHLDGVYVAENKCDISGVSASCTGTCTYQDPANPSNKNLCYDPAYGGEINTCGTPSNVNASNPDGAFIGPGQDMFTACDKQQLEVTGSFIDHATKLDRTFASTHNSVASETPFNPITGYSCSQGNGSAGAGWVSGYGNSCAAEIFNFNPTTYLAPPTFNTGPQPSYDSIVSLPPVF